MGPMHPDDWAFLGFAALIAVVVVLWAFGG